jgi:hypothetical protein
MLVCKSARPENGTFDFGHVSRLYASHFASLVGNRRANVPRSMLRRTDSHAAHLDYQKQNTSDSLARSWEYVKMRMQLLSGLDFSFRSLLTFLAQIGNLAEPRFGFRGNPTPDGPPVPLAMGFSDGL